MKGGRVPSKFGWRSIAEIAAGPRRPRRQIRHQFLGDEGRSMESKHSNGGALGVLRFFAGALALVAGGAAAGQASAADACIGAKAKEAISQCPGGTLQQSTAKKPQ